MQRTHGRRSQAIRVDRARDKPGPADEAGTQPPLLSTHERGHGRTARQQSQPPGTPRGRQVESRQRDIVVAPHRRRPEHRKGVLPTRRDGNRTHCCWHAQETVGAGCGQGPGTEARRQSMVSRQHWQATATGRFPSKSLEQDVVRQRYAEMTESHCFCRSRAMGWRGVWQSLESIGGRFIIFNLNFPSTYSEYCHTGTGDAGNG